MFVDVTPREIIDAVGPVCVYMNQDTLVTMVNCTETGTAPSLDDMISLGNAFFFFSLSGNVAEL